MKRHCADAPYPRDGLLSWVEPRSAPVRPGLRYARALAGIGRGTAWGARHVCRVVRGYGGLEATEYRSDAASRRGTPRRPHSR